MPPRVIVVGAGLSGLSAAHTIYLAGGNVVLLDKNNFMGGNSTKATSGINGALTQTQVDEKIGDSVKQFYDDTLKSARDKARPDLIKVLTYKSAAAVEWLQEVFNLDLTLVSRLGGHSFPRTHRGHDAKFPGMAITYALMQRFEELAEKEPERVQLIKKAKVNTEKSSGSFLPHLFLDLSMGLTVKVTNRDYLGVYYDYLNVGIAYRGEKIGRVTSENGAYIPPRGTAYVDATLDIEGFQVLADVIYLLEDIAHGHIPLQTVTDFDGYIRLFSLKVPLQAIMSCEVVVDTNEQTVLRQECELG